MRSHRAERVAVPILSTSSPPRLHDPPRKFFIKAIRNSKLKMVSPAFIPAAAHPLATPTTRAVTARRAPVMSMRKFAARLATIPATLATVAPALAEGTGEGLGIDSGLLYLPLIAIPAVLLVFYLQFDGSQNKEDFFGEYDERRN